MDKLWFKARRVISVLLVFAMLASLTPVQAFAVDEGTTDVPSETQVVEQEPASTEGGNAGSEDGQKTDPPQNETGSEDSVILENNDEGTPTDPAQESGTPTEEPAATPEVVATPDPTAVPTPEATPEVVATPDPTAAPTVEPAKTEEKQAEEAPANEMDAAGLSDEAEPETPATVESVSTQAGSVTATVTATLPAEAALTMTETELTNDQLTAVEKALPENTEIVELQAWDIALTGAELEDKVPVAITGTDLEAGDGYFVAHINSDNTVDTGSYADGVATVSVSSFSPFVVASTKKVEEEPEATPTPTPKVMPDLSSPFSLEPFGRSFTRVGGYDLGSTVFVYVQLTGDDPDVEVNINGNGWYTIGVTTIEGLPPFDSVNHTDNIISSVSGDKIKNAIKNVVRYEGNAGLNLNGVQWNSLKWSWGALRGDGGDEYVNSNHRTWHLDGTLDIQNAQKWNVIYTDGTGKEAVFGNQQKMVLDGDHPFAFAGDANCREGYTFTGWLCSTDERVYSSEEVVNLNITADTTFTAQWKADQVDYKVNVMVEAYPDKDTATRVEYVLDPGIAEKTIPFDNSDEVTLEDIIEKYGSVNITYQDYGYNKTEQEYKWELNEEKSTGSIDTHNHTATLYYTRVLNEGEQVKDSKGLVIKNASPNERKDAIRQGKITVSTHYYDVTSKDYIVDSSCNNQEIYFIWQQYNMIDLALSNVPAGYAIYAIKAKQGKGSSSAKPITASLVDNTVGDTHVDIYLVPKYTVEYYQEDTQLTVEPYANVELYPSKSVEDATVVGNNLPASVMVAALPEIQNSVVTGWFDKGNNKIEPGTVINADNLASMADGKVVKLTCNVQSQVAYQIKYYLDDSEEPVENPYDGAPTGTTVDVNSTIDVTDLEGYQTSFDYADTHYTLDRIDNNPLQVAENGNNIISVFYATDEIGTNNPEEPDDIPDKYQVTVTYDVVNGTWTEGGVDQKSEVVTLRDEQQMPSEEGSVTVKMPGTVANIGYTGGTWDPADATVTKNSDHSFVCTYVVDESQRYTVTYVAEANGSVAPASENAQVLGTEGIKGATATPNDGYYVEGWYKDNTKIGDGNVLSAEKVIENLNTSNGVYADTTFTVKFVIRTDLSYTVRYLEDGTARELNGAKVVGGQTFGATVTESAINIPGYTMTSDKNPQSITIGTGENVITFYYKEIGPDVEPTPTETPTTPTIPTTPTTPTTPVGPTTPTVPATGGPSVTAAPEATQAPAEEEIQEEETPLAPEAGEGEEETIGEGETPLAGGNAAWALLNLILTILTALGSLILLIGYFIGRNRREEEDETTGETRTEYEVNRHGFWRLVSLIPGIGAIIVFILTEDMSLPMVFVDKWTLLMVIIAVIQIVIAVLSMRNREEPDEDDQANA